MNLYTVRFDERATRQLEGIDDWIASNGSPRAAESFIDAILDECASLGVYPHRGHRRDDILPGLRTLGFRRRVVIVFSVQADTVAILGIFYGGQDYESTLR